MGSYKERVGSWQGANGRRQWARGSWQGAVGKGQLAKDIGYFWGNWIESGLGNFIFKGFRIKTN